VGLDHCGVWESVARGIGLRAIVTSATDKTSDRTEPCPRTIAAESAGPADHSRSNDLDGVD